MVFFAVDLVTMALLIPTTYARAKLLVWYTASLNILINELWGAPNTCNFPDIGTLKIRRGPVIHSESDTDSVWLAAAAPSQQQNPHFPKGEGYSS